MSVCLSRDECRLPHCIAQLHTCSPLEGEQSDSVCPHGRSGSAAPAERPGSPAWVPEGPAPARPGRRWRPGSGDHVISSPGCQVSISTLGSLHGGKGDGWSKGSVFPSGSDAVPRNAAVPRSLPSEQPTSHQRALRQCKCQA